MSGILTTLDGGNVGCLARCVVGAVEVGAEVLLPVVEQSLASGEGRVLSRTA